MTAAGWDSSLGRNLMVYGRLHGSSDRESKQIQQQKHWTMVEEAVSYWDPMFPSNRSRFLGQQQRRIVCFA